MKLRTFSMAADFLDVVGPTLYASEAENSLLLGIALRLVDGHRYSDDAPFLSCIEEAGRLPLIALRTPPHNLLLCTDGAPSEALALISEYLAEMRVTLAGVHGRADAATAFAGCGKRRRALRPGSEWSSGYIDSMRSRLPRACPDTRAGRRKMTSARSRLGPSASSMRPYPTTPNTMCGAW